MSNLFRKLLGNNRGVKVTEAGSPVEEAPSTDNSLGLMHLRKLFAEFRHPVSNPNPQEVEDKLYNMLPLFCRVFGSSPSSEMTEKFGDVLQFCSHVSKLMVTEIRRRASNQDTETASCAIVKFLEIAVTEETSNGWMLLSTLNLLVSGSPSLIDCMTGSSLPSTMVKCLYLFFDLPTVQNGDQLGEGDEFTPKERRILLQRMVTQVLVRLCSHQAPAEELARKDDLTLLFSAITSWCPTHNVPWRKSASEVLMTLSRHGLTPNVVQYIHSKGCVSLCIDNMQRVQELSPLEIVEMFVSVFCFLKDSSEVAQILLDDFRQCQGYMFLSEFLLRLEKDESEESKQALRNLVLLVGSLVTCGFIELKPSQASTGSLYQMPGFTIPQPSGKGVSVRNIQAFQVLQSVFLKSTMAHLCSIILDVINSIYHQDNANYFILESQHTLSQFAEKIHLKPFDIQHKFFDILMFIVSNLNFVPCKELISISILLKTHSSLECSLLAIKCLLKVLKFHSIYKDVYREVGLLEVITTCLHKYAAQLGDTSNQSTNESENKLEEEFGHQVMEALSLLLSNSTANAGVFRECGGARCTHQMVPYDQCRQPALNIIQQLILCSGDGDDMAALLGMMHTAHITALQLKSHILKALLSVLRESHKTRTTFRKVGGFVYVMSVLISMEGCLSDPARSLWELVGRKEILSILKLVFSVLTVAMRYEPANAKYFKTEVQYSSLTKAVKLLGCFSSQSFIQPMSANIELSEESSFNEFFASLDEERVTDLPNVLVSACVMIRYLHDMSLDNFQRVNTKQANNAIEGIILRNNSSLIRKAVSMNSAISDRTSEEKPKSLQSSPVTKRASTGAVTLTLLPNTPDVLVVHAGAAASILHLLPAIYCDSNYELECDLQSYTAATLKALMRSERNQQIMCEAGLPHDLLTYCNVAFEDEGHFLHPPLQYIFERLAAQWLSPKDLRDFLRLGLPLSCGVNEDEHDEAIPAPPGDETSEIDVTHSNHVSHISIGKPVPLTRVKCLVSMTTPKDMRLHSSAVLPSFVQFDMNVEGFACLYLPSIAPQGPPTPSVVGITTNSDQAVHGGIGTGERVFPPQSGMSFSTWFNVDKYSLNSGNDAHPVRLLTVVRMVQGRDDCVACLRIFIQPKDRSVIVSTKETAINIQGAADFDTEPHLDEHTARFWCPEMTQEGQWHHLVVVLNKAGMLKNSNVSLYINGALVNTQKLHYISPNLGVPGTASPNAIAVVFAYIGTSIMLRKPSKLLWRQGSCYLIEDVLPAPTVDVIHKLGPNYTSCFQAPVIGSSDDAVGPLVAEEKVMFGLHAHVVSFMSLSKIKKHYSKFDAKSIARLLNMSAHDNSTPLRVLPNAAGHLPGPARTLGAILIGYQGVRGFSAKPVAKQLQYVGGTCTLLGLIAMANDVEQLYAAVKALVCVVRSNSYIMNEMDRCRGYQTLGMLYKKKRHLLNSHILHLTFSLVGTVDSARETSVIPNKMAFQDLLCDLEVWQDSTTDLQRSLYEHFYELLTETSEHQYNWKTMKEIGLVGKLVQILKGKCLTCVTIETISSLICALLQGARDSTGLLRFGQFVVSLLTLYPVSENSVVLNNTQKKKDDYEAIPAVDTSDASGLMSPYHIKLRNVCLEVFTKLLNVASGKLNQHVSDEIQRVLGFDWLMLFMQGHLHRSTVVMATRILIAMLGNVPTMARFREGAFASGWLDETEAVLKNKLGTLLGFNVGRRSSVAVGRSTEEREINLDVCHQPGFNTLQWVLPQHADIPELYFFLLSMLLDQTVLNMPDKVQFDLDTIWTFIFGVPASKPVSGNQAKGDNLCAEACLVILAMIRAMLNPNPWFNQEFRDAPDGSWLLEYPVTLMQFLLFLYHNQPNFGPMCMTGDILCGLAATLFPYRFTNGTASELSSPIDEIRSLPGSDPLLLVKAKDNTEVTGSLSRHPARKFIMDFLRLIIVDSLSLTSATKSTSVIDLVLDASPEHSTKLQRKEFQTEIIKNIMDHLLAADVLLGEQAALPIAVGGSYGNMVNNVFYFASRVIDRLWQGMYLRESKEIFDFVSKLIAQAKRRATGLSLDPIYKCLNRTILYHLSRPTYSVADQMLALDTLHRLTSNRGLVFGPGNYDQEFIGCLCYCLLQLTEDPESLTSEEAKKRLSTFHISIDDDTDAEAIEDVIPQSGLKGPNIQEGHQLVNTAAKRVWEELYFCKKPALEEIFKCSLNPDETKKLSTPDLYSVRPLILDSATKIWTTFVEVERRASIRDSEKIQHQITNKLQKVGSGVLRLARSTKSKKDLPIRITPTLQHEFSNWTNTHVSIVQDLIDMQFSQYHQNLHHMEKYLMEEWLQTESELMRERGLWGPTTRSNLDKWMLDLTEGPHRMRRKLMKNEMFYIHYPYDPDLKNKPVKFKHAVSRDSKKNYERFRANSLVGTNTTLHAIAEEHMDQSEPRSLAEVLEETKSDSAFQPPRLLARNLSRKSNSGDNDEEDADEMSTSFNLSTASLDSSVDNSSNTEGKKPGNEMILRLLDEGEKISHMFRCARVLGLDTSEGLLLFGKEHFYVVDGFTLLSTREIVDLDTVPPEAHDPIIPRTTRGPPPSTKRLCGKFAYEDIREVHRRRYLLQPIAVEFFSGDGRNYLLAFPRKVRNKVYTRFLAVATSIEDNAHQSVSGQKQNARVEPGTGLISSFMGEKSVTQRWERGEISNFQYLMHLNTLADRSYNDLMQYPVFPWILADYDSEELDLKDPNTFRDFSKPMGAQTPDRLKNFIKRYQDWDDPTGETPEYHYGTHYSSAMIVASYLLRMEPFTQHFLNLQGGHFDLADRMFHSVKENWLSASKHNMADVKELVPEFFYLPEFLVNSNQFDLGAKQSGVELSDVILPPWAKGDPREFIRVHRQALECDYVSSHLHEWIDLIFGYKQNGPPAVEAVNVFHHLFYEGNVDIYTIDDPLKKNATIGFINNFGQIPKQLFKRPHPQKKLNLRQVEPNIASNVASSAHADKLFFHNLDNLKPSMSPMKELKTAVGHIVHSDKLVLAVEQNKVLTPPLYNKYLAWGYADLSIRVGSYESDKSVSVYENIDDAEILCAVCPTSRILITGGTSTVVNVWQFTASQGKDRRQLSLKQSLFGHTETVTCIAASSSYNIIVSGSRDKTCIIWDFSRLIFVRQLPGHLGPVACVSINEATGDIATCAGTYLYVWSVNGEYIASVNTATAGSRNQQILCVAMSQVMEWDIQNVIMTGSSDGVVRMWSVEFVQVPEKTNSPIYSNSAAIASQDSFPDAKDTEYGSSLGSESSLLDRYRNEAHRKDSKTGIDQSESVENDNVPTGELIDLDEDSSSCDRLSIKSVNASIDSAVDVLVDIDNAERLSSDELKPESASISSSDFVNLEDHDAQKEALSADEVLRKYKLKRGNVLREGFKWQRQLVFRSKLTMHTAFERKDNNDPAAVTALAISKDHKIIYVGDQKGRIFNWSVTDQPGKVVADHWIKDEGRDSCVNCNTRFSTTFRRHHCRNCGQLFCSKCSSQQTEIHRLRIMKPVRVCQACYKTLRAQQVSDSLTSKRSSTLSKGKQSS